MKETIELRINFDYSNLLFKEDEGKNLGTSVKVVELAKEDPRYDQISRVAKEVKTKYNSCFFFGWQIKRKYSKKELDTARLLQLKIKAVFEPTGEECGTVFDETVACEICGANRKQIGSLILKRGTIPKKDIVKTIGGEVIVSEKFVKALRQTNLEGLNVSAINVEGYYQLTADNEIELSAKTITGINPFDLSTCSEGEIYVCPKGHTIGLNLLSEAYVMNNRSVTEKDFFASEQKIGVKRGLLRPQPIYFCSQEFRNMINHFKLSGSEFEIANIE